MKISTPALGLVAMAASPFLFIELCLDNNGNSSLGGVCDLIYMAGWMSTIIALLRLNATGYRKRDRTILYVQMGVLAVAQIWNIWTIADPQNSNVLYSSLDNFWPISNLTLLIVGIIVAVKGVLRARNRYTVMIAGFWLPFSIITFMLVGQGITGVILSGMYSTITWFGMGHMIWKIAAAPPRFVEREVVATTRNEDPNRIQK